MLKNLSLKVKFIAMFLAIGLVPLIAVSLISYNTSSNNIRDEVNKSLDMFAGLINSQMDDYFTEREGDVQVFAASSNVIDALSALRAAGGDETSEGWLSRKAILDRYTQIVKEEYDFIFVYVADTNGRAVYSSNPAYEGTDFSNRVNIQGALRGDIAWSELMYSDVVGENVINISAPIRSNGQVIGAATLVISETVLDSIVHDGVEELGESGDSYLINAQGLLLTNTRLGSLAQNASLRETISTEAVQMLSGPISQGNTDYHGNSIYPNYLGNDVLGAVEVVRFGDGYAGLVIEVDYNEAFAGVYTMRNAMLMIAFVAALLVAAVGFFVATNTAKPIIQVAAVAKVVAAGDFTVSTDIKRSDEIGELANAFNSMNDSLRNLMRQAVQTARGVNEGSDSLSQAVESVSASLEQVAASTNQFTTNTQELSSNAQEMSAISNEVAASAAEGSKAVDNAVTQMQEINKMVEELRDIIQVLDRRSQEIGSIVGLITDVADQTNLLALNAAIEAARAGEQGRGFAVVAEEVRKLAEQSRKSADEIANLVKETLAESKNAVDSMQSGVEKVKAGTEVVISSGETFKEIVMNVGQIVKTIDVVSSAAQEISAGSEEIAASTEEQSSVMEEINASAEELKANAESLISELRKFKYEG